MFSIWSYLLPSPSPSPIPTIHLKQQYLMVSCLLHACIFHTVSLVLTRLKWLGKQQRAVTRTHTQKTHTTYDNNDNQWWTMQSNTQKVNYYAVNQTGWNYFRRITASTRGSKKKKKKHVGDMAEKIKSQEGCESNTDAVCLGGNYTSDMVFYYNKIVNELFSSNYLQCAS